MDLSPNAALLAALKRTLERLEWHVSKIPAAQRTSDDQLALELARTIILKLDNPQRKIPMKDYTVIGFYPDTKQRFADTTQANDPDSAEEFEVEQHPGLVVCGVIAGRHATEDSCEFVEY